MSERLELHLIETPKYSIIFHPPTYTILKVGEKAGRVLDEYSKGHSLADIGEKYGLKLEDTVSLIENVRGFLGQQQPVNFDYRATEPKEVLPKLELMVSNDCNLNCVYCYAYGGDYGREASQMTEETAVKAVDRMLERFKEVESIVFFGGEPLMNVPAIETVCQYLESKVLAGELHKMPSFGIITNGTLINEKAADLLRRYNIRVTVSIDGPKEVNDKLRPFKSSGCGTYESIKKGIENLHNQNLNPHFEATYTQYHINRGFSPVDVLEHLQTELGFGQGNGAIGDAEVGDGDPLNIKDSVKDFYEPLFDWSMQKFMDGTLMAGDMGISISLQILFKQPRTHICPAGYESLAIIPTGDIFPCHILVDKDEFIMGNIEDENWYNSFSADNVYRMLKLARKEENPYCNKCWARYICAGCLGGWEPDGANQVFISEAGCDVKRAIWDTIIRKTVELKDDPASWEKVEQYLIKILEENKNGKSSREHASTAAKQQLVQIQSRNQQRREEFARPAS